MRSARVWLEELLVRARPAAALAAAVLSLQALVAAQTPEGLDVDIAVDEGGAWYADPVWLAIAVIGIVLLIVIVAMAARGGGTTVVKE